ncbi:hypothetical protein Tco_1027527 [Tanacetum coccineum]
MTKKKDTKIPHSSITSDPTNIANEAVNKEPSMQLKELTDFCTKFQQRVLELENTNTAQAQEITCLKKRVKKSRRVVSSDEDCFGVLVDRIEIGVDYDMDAVKDIYLVDVHTRCRLFGAYDLKFQVKDNKIDLLVQQYEQFTILEEESIDSGFARFNIIITSLKALDEGFSSKSYVRKFLRALHPKWRAKVTTIKESKD